ncbi:Peptidyl-prolyl cis-trans isomerase CWC27 like protein [Eufriesea mexicana]|uniref:Spliceosome-associated protein CWC27 homolog n=1 Tax=Eufriesea mexicana TaxID=516756 RepID=A0A310SH94_9HYME|nr:Peptidyl-prolyl cis-trans isomerase CWC27 like protein [Eufriesea mexicana]
MYEKFTLTKPDTTYTSAKQPSIRINHRSKAFLDHKQSQTFHFENVGELAIIFPTLAGILRFRRYSMRSELCSGIHRGENRVAISDGCSRGNFGHFRLSPGTQPDTNRLLQQRFRETDDARANITVLGRDFGEIAKLWSRTRSRDKSEVRDTSDGEKSTWLFAEFHLMNTPVRISDTEWWKSLVPTTSRMIDEKFTVNLHSPSENARMMELRYIKKGRGPNENNEKRKAYYVESRNIEEIVYVLRMKDVWHQHTNMGIIEEMENEHLVIVMKGKVKLNIKCKCCIKVIMKTTVGAIELELQAKETPKTCRNFIQLCINGYWDDTIFHRIIKGFITQGDDSTGTEKDGKIYGEPFKDEFHTRLRFCRRDLIAMANAGKDDNGSQFFFTLSSTPELQNKHTTFGKVTGESIYNMFKREEALVDENNRPLYPPKLTRTMILSNPFSDVIPRIIVQESEELKDSSKTKIAAVKDFNLLSIGEEAEEDEEESVILNKKFSGKDKSTHDHLSSQPAVEPPGLANKKRKADRVSD